MIGHQDCAHIETAICIFTVRIYCKTFNVSVPFISRILRAKQNREFKGQEYQLQVKIGRNYYSISNCMVLIHQNIRDQNNFAW